MPAPPPALVLDDVTVVVDGARALDGFSLSVRRGQICALLGASGAGKTTALRVVSGLVAPTDGQVWLGGERVSDGGAALPPERRSVGVVFQEMALFPHLDAAANVRFGAPSVDVEAALNRMHLTGFERRAIDGLSGGEQQRVAIARALARPADLFLLDEPLSRVDGALRRSLRRAVVDAIRRTEAACVWITHDPDEAFEVADVIAVADSGRVLQTGPPNDVYSAPTSRAVASATGPAAFLPWDVAAGTTRLSAPDATAALAARPSTGSGWLVFRPESLTLAPTGAVATVRATRFSAGRTTVEVALPAGTFAAHVPEGDAPPVGATVRVRAAGPVAVVPHE